MIIKKFNSLNLQPSNIVKISYQLDQETITKKEVVSSISKIQHPNGKNKLAIKLSCTGYIFIDDIKNIEKLANN